MKTATRRPFVSALLLTAICSFSSFADVPAGYYDRLEGLSGASLKKAAKNVAKNHTAVSYGDATWEAFRTTDTHYVNNQLVWWDMYSPNNVAVASGHPGMNIEHSVANSWWGGSKNDAYKDLFHLNPSNSDANSRKSNYPLGEVATETWSNGITFVGKPKSGTCGGATYVYEPADQYKGDFARVFFYMFTIYDDISWTSSWNWMYDTSSDLTLKPWAYELLLKWAKEDPVSQKEIDRNEAVYKIQKNRNPFIDNPELAEHIWGSKKNQPFHADGSYTPDPDPDPDPDVPDTPTPGPGPTPSGYWYAVTSAANLNETDLYILVDAEENIAMSYNLGSSGKFFEVCGMKPGVDNSYSPQRLSSVPDDVAVWKLTASGGGWKVAVSDLNGNFKGYLQSTEMKNVTLTSSSSVNGCVVKITPSSSQTTLTYSYSSNSGNLEYNKAAPRFTTYNSGQQPVRLYRLEQQGGTNGIATGFEVDQVIVGIYDINGRKMQAETIDDLDSGIYIVVSNTGVKKIIR